MHRTIKIAARIAAPAAIAATAVIASATMASASVTIDANGKGFVGKGDVQTAFGWTNAKLQDNAVGLTFTTKQSATQALSSEATQTATQKGTQTGTQSATQFVTQEGTQQVTDTLSCTKNGAEVQRVRHGVRTDVRTGERDGTRIGSRDGSREGSRQGSRTGSRAGTISGSIASGIAYESRKSNQITGFNLTGKTESPFAATGSENWSAPEFTTAYNFDAWSFDGSTWAWEAPEFSGDPQWTNDYDFAADFSDVVWGPWDTDNTNADPDVCLNSGGGISNLSDPVPTAGDVVDGAIAEVKVTYGDDIAPSDDVIEGITTDGATKPGTTVPGSVTRTGSPALFVTWNNILRPL